MVFLVPEYCLELFCFRVQDFSEEHYPNANRSVKFFTFPSLSYQEKFWILLPLSFPWICEPAA